MKKIITIIAVMFCINAQAQQIDTVKSAILVKPVLINWINKDTVFQVTWRLFDLTRDTTQGCNSYVQMYDRKGKQIADKNVPIDANTIKIWTVDAIIDNYILFSLGLQKK